MKSEHEKNVGEDFLKNQAKYDNVGTADLKATRKEARKQLRFHRSFLADQESMGNADELTDSIESSKEAIFRQTLLVLALENLIILRGQGHSLPSSGEGREIEVQTPDEDALFSPDFLARAKLLAPRQSWTKNRIKFYDDLRFQFGDATSVRKLFERLEQLSEELEIRCPYKNAVTLGVAINNAKRAR